MLLLLRGGAPFAHGTSVPSSSAHSHGGLREGLLVELSNGGMALVVRADDETVVLDANNMLAGKALWFELELAALDRPGAA